MNNETIESFAKYRLDKAKETLQTAKKFLKMGKILQVQIIEHITQSFMLSELYLPLKK